MIPPVEVVAFSGALTGNGVPDYTSNLYLPDTLEGYVTVVIDCIDKGTLAQIEYNFHAGNTVDPVREVYGQFGQATGIVDASWSRLVNMRVTIDYFRVSLTGTGNPSGSDVLVRYHYLPKSTPALQVQSINNALYITNE